MKTFEIEISETYKCIAYVQAETAEQAISFTKKLYEDGVIKLDSEDISETQYSIRR